MEMHKTVTEAGCILLACCSIVFGSFFTPQPPTAHELLQAPAVILGGVASVRPELTPLRPPLASARATTSTLVIKEGLALRGSLRTDSPVVRFGLGPQSDDPWGPPAREGGNYVFFLSADAKSKECRAATKHGFALEIENLPPAEAMMQGTTETLRAIAKANIEATSETIAARWCDLLGGMYRDEDKQVFADLAYTSLSTGLVYSDMTFEKVFDERWHLRGTALAVLCENGDLTSATYEQSIGFLRRFKTGPSLTDYWEWPSRQGLGTLCNRIVKRIGEDAKRNPPSSSRLREWLSSGVKELESLSMDIATENRSRDLIPDLLAFMQRTPDDYLRYDSWGAVEVMDGNIRGSGRDTFMADQARCMRETLARHPAAPHAP